MKRFLLFLGDDYYPYGGFYDFADSFNTLDEAKTHIVERLLKTKANPDWWQVVDTTLGGIVAEGRSSDFNVS